ncbi:MAG: ABC transporter permease [Hydrogenophilales bacterium 16-64-46]|nr:MAG: ABC transporter permease [Hydrogenophilales bacterium 12-64-13]OYZ06573.1 MAG: ABC transporter permease [Hydrogenophilales bacterium 16-64-46]OZA39281.1 MAG: ABC transporter permease [Hydrogenophilales bacterium 17-64-34]HQS98835.1 ABC transporter permease [Thiobacillus sp.]
MFRLAVRNIFRNRLRTALTLAAIMCGVAAVILSGGFVEDVFVQLRESTIHSRLGHAQVMRQGYREFGQREPTRYMIESAEPVLKVARSLPQIREVMTRVNFSGLANNGRADLPIIGEGVEPGKEGRLGSAIDFIAGRNLTDGDAFGVVVGEGVAAALKLKPGNPLNLAVSTPDGALNTLEFTVTGIFRSFSKEYDDRAVRISQAAAQELLYTAAVHSVIIALTDTAHTDAVVTELRARLGQQGFEVKPWYELADFYNKTVALYKRQFGALQFIILMMLVLSVTSTINMVIYERTGEFGTLLALGMKRRRIFRLVLLENALLGIVGAALGVLAGLALALGISAMGLDMPPPPGSSVGYTASIRIVPWVLAVAAATGAMSAVLASVLPGRRAARLGIVEALRHNI